MNISLSDVGNLIGDVPQAVERGGYIQPPRTGGDAGSSIAALLGYANSERRTSKFLEWAATQPDLDYRAYIKQAAKSGVINNPRTMAYAEILKEKFGWEQAKKTADFNREQEQQQYQLNQRRGSERSAKQNAFRDALLTRLSIDESSPDGITVDDNILSKFDKDPLFVDKAASTLEKSMFGKEDGLTSDERSAVVSDVIDRVKTAWSIKKQESINEAQLEKERVRAEAADKKARLSARGVDKVISPGELGQKVATAITGLRDAEEELRKAREAAVSDKSDGGKKITEAERLKLNRLEATKAEQEKLKYQEVATERVFNKAANPTIANRNIAAATGRPLGEIDYKKNLYADLDPLIKGINTKNKNVTKEKVQKELDKYGAYKFDDFFKIVDGKVQWNESWENFKNASKNVSYQTNFLDTEGNPQSAISGGLSSGGLQLGGGSSQKTTAQIAAEIKAKKGITQ